jgi:hypothetical protein
LGRKKGIFFLYGYLFIPMLYKLIDLTMAVIFHRNFLRKLIFTLIFIIIKQTFWEFSSVFLVLCTYKNKVYKKTVFLSVCVRVCACVRVRVFYRIKVNLKHLVKNILSKFNHTWQDCSMGQGLSKLFKEFHKA